MLVRINKLISSTGLYSRREADQLIQAGQVCVNGKLINQLGTMVEADASVTVGGKKLIFSKPICYAVHKPTGYICSRKAQDQRPLVGELVPTHPPVYPVGRLDLESEGLIILTNIGSLAEQILSPKHLIPKVYLVYLTPKKKISQNAESVQALCHKLEHGVNLGDGKAKAIKASGKLLNPDTIRLEIVVMEGRNHLIRRMSAAAGYQVKRLIRTQIGGLKLSALKVGRYQILNTAEQAKLFEKPI